MNNEIIWLVVYTAFVIGWFIYWFGTYHGDRVLNGFSNLVLHAFAFLSGSLIVALSYGFGYVVLNNLMRFP